MTTPSLQVTYRRGKPLVAYLRLPRRGRAKSVHTREMGPGLLMDFARDGKPVGLEIVSPDRVTVRQINRALRSVGLGPVGPGELSPLPIDS